MSTYSNLDNHPSVLGTGRKERTKRRPRGAAAAAEARATGIGGVEGSAMVELSEKTGLPIGVLPERTFNDT